MSKSISLLAIGVMALGIVAGCANEDTTVSKEKDQQIRDNFSRSLTPDEVAQMKGGGAKAPDKKAPDTE